VRPTTTTTTTTEESTAERTTTEETLTTTAQPPPPTGDEDEETELPTLFPDRPERVFFKNCREARQAGAAPLRRGEPGYRNKLDRDGDGIACD
jgi:hypothetical protein